MKKLTAYMLAGTFLVLSTSAANAESFTYRSQGDTPTVIGGTTPEGVPYGGTYTTGKGETTWANGSKSGYSYKCVATIQPPRNTIFMSHMACDVIAPDGTFSASFGCNPIGTNPENQGCVGGLLGKSGRYTGRRGSVTNHGKGVISIGTGQWYE